MYIGNNPRNNKYIVPLCGFLLSILSLLAIPQICFSTMFDGNYDSATSLYTKEAGADGCVHVSYTSGGWQNMNLGVSEDINTNASINMLTTNIQFVDPSSCHCDGNDYTNCGQYNGKEIKFGGSTMSGGSVSGAKGQTFTYGNMPVQVDIGSVLGAEPGLRIEEPIIILVATGGAVDTLMMQTAEPSQRRKNRSRLKKTGLVGMNATSPLTKFAIIAIIQITAIGTPM